MSMKVIFGEILEGRQTIADYVSGEKSKFAFKVVDVGGSAVGWSRPLVDAFVDINAITTEKAQFAFDICKHDAWKDLLDHVDRVGKFDFCICTHTLEDIYNPYLVLDNLPKIAKAGVITMPSIKMEISHVENINWSGYLHHRYLFGHKDGKMVIAPKLPIIEKLNDKMRFDRVEEIRFWWQDTIDYEIFMDNYLGPNVDTVLSNLEEFLKEQLR